MTENEKIVNELIRSVTYASGVEEPILPYVGAKASLIGILFLYTMANLSKIATIENKDDLLTMEMFRSKFFNDGKFPEDILSYDEDLLGKFLSIFEKKFNLPSGILEINSLKKYLQDNLNTLNENLYLSESFHLGENPLQIDYQPVLTDLINRPQNSKDTTNTYRYYTNESLQQLVAKILDVNKTETFMDCCCGMFSSALHNDAAHYIGIEQNYDMAGIAAMILIMCNKKFDLKLGNFVESEYENIAEKIFTDISYGADMSKIDNRPYGKNGDAYCIENTVKALKEGGTAVIACLGSVLLKQDSSKKLRETITRDHLKAVITLPSMNKDSGVNTHLIVLEKNCHAKTIKFINASNFEIENQKRLTLKDSDISEIIGCFKGKKSTCPAINVKTDDILNSSNISWSPNQYVWCDKSVITRTVNEIDQDLQASYKELEGLLYSKV